MTHEVLVNIILGSHTPLLAGAVLAYYKYGDRTDTFAKAMQGTNALLAKLHRQVATEFRECVGPVVSQAFNQSSSAILGADGDTYSERLPNVTESEAFREGVNTFVTKGSKSLVHLRAAVEARDSWVKHAKRLSWGIWLLIGWTGLVVVALIMLEKVFVVGVPEWLLKASWIVVSVLSVGIFAALGLLQKHHDTLCNLRSKYDCP